MLLATNKQGLMHKLTAVSLLLSSALAVLHAQEVKGLPRSSFRPYVEYANTSSHIILGTSRDRKIAAAGIEYSHKLLRTKKLSWNYMFDLRPVMFFQDPVSTTTLTVQFVNKPPFGPFTIQQGPIERTCQSATFSDPNNQQNNVSLVETRVCGTRWTYAGGFSPLGQEVTFLPTYRIQPVILGNAGLVVATQDIPADNSSSLNFTFEFGAGLRIMRSRTRGICVDYRLRHLSNAYLGNTNPGIDSQLIRVSYILSRR